jgi:hypothetical protein
MKRFASNYLLTGGSFLRLHVVEIDDDGEVRRYSPLKMEEEAVEWLPGVIELTGSGKSVHAYHLFPFDFDTMTSCDGTRRTLLR